MLDFLATIFSPPNVIFSVLLCLLGFYWLAVIIGALSTDSFDLDLHHDADLDLDAGADLGGDLDAGHDLGHDLDHDVGHELDHDVGHDAGHDAGEGGAHVGGALRGVLLFFNLGEIPLMIMLSLTILIMWAGAVLLNRAIGNESFLLSLLLFVPLLIGSLLVAKVLSTPVKPVFRALAKQTEQYQEMIGKICVVTTSEANAEFGQATIETKDAPLLFNIRTEHGLILVQGEEALVTGHDRKLNVYWVTKA